MSEEHWLVIGLAHPRAGWFRQMASWATTAAVPLDFVKCVSAEEVRARIASGRPYSAALLGSDAVGLDAGLIDLVTTTGAAAIVVGDGRDRDWRSAGATATLQTPFDRADLVAVLSEHAPPAATLAPNLPDAAVSGRETCADGRLIAVTGPGGSGTSITAMALAQELGSSSDTEGEVLLADLALDADQAMLHDARELIPGLQELVDAHRLGRPNLDDVRSHTFDAVGRGYSLLLGLRRHRDWTTLRMHALSQALEQILDVWEWVVADLDSDVEGESETGSSDIEERNLLARTVLLRADCILVTGTAGTKGIHSLTRVLREFLSIGVTADRLVPVVTRAPRSPRSRAEIDTALHELIGAATGLEQPPCPIFVPERRDVETSIRDATRLPQPMGLPLATTVVERLAALDRRTATRIAAAAVVPGTLGTWTGEF